VHLRRALLLFAIVLGLAAVAATVSNQRPESGRDPLTTPPPSPQEPATASPGSGPPAQEAANLSFEAGRDQTRRLAAGRPATVRVSVDEPGQVEIPLLGVGAPADPVTPARFELLTSEAGRYPISFTPAAGDEAGPAGTLAITEAEQ
jgi:hypothetical protein